MDSLQVARMIQEGNREAADAKAFSAFAVQITGAFAGAVFSFLAFLMGRAIGKRDEQWKTYRVALGRLDEQCNGFYNRSISWRRLLANFTEASEAGRAAFSLPREFAPDTSIYRDLWTVPWPAARLLDKLVAFDTDLGRLNSDFENFNAAYRQFLTAYWSSEKITHEHFRTQAKLMSDAVPDLLRGLDAMDANLEDLWARAHWELDRGGGPRRSKRFRFWVTKMSRKRLSPKEDDIQRSKDALRKVLKENEGKLVPESRPSPSEGAKK